MIFVFVIDLFDNINVKKSEYKGAYSIHIAFL